MGVLQNEGGALTCCDCSAVKFCPANMSKGSARPTLGLEPGGGSTPRALVCGLFCGDCWGVTCGWPCVSKLPFLIVMPAI